MHLANVYYAGPNQQKFKRNQINKYIDSKINVIIGK